MCIKKKIKKMKKKIKNSDFFKRFERLSFEIIKK